MGFRPVLFCLYLQDVKKLVETELGKGEGPVSAETPELRLLNRPIARRVVVASYICSHYFLWKRSLFFLELSVKENV